MSKVFIIGAAGKVGQRLARLLATRGHQVRAMHRHPAQADALQALGAEPVSGSLLDRDVQGLSRLMTGSDAVVFTAGAGGKGGAAMTNAIDGDGLELAVASAKLAGIRRFLLVSVFPEALRGQTVSDTFEHYITVKKRADGHLVESGLDWIILRPGTLLDAPGTDKVRAGVAIPYGDITRDDVALVLATLIEQPDIGRIIIELTQGDTPVHDAMQRLVRH